MNKLQLINMVAAKSNLNKAQTQRALESLLQSISETLAANRNERISLSGFGTFTVTQRKGRRGADPQTGDPIFIPASTLVRFKNAPALKKLLNT